MWVERGVTLCALEGWRGVGRACATRVGQECVGYLTAASGSDRLPGEMVWRRQFRRGMAGSLRRFSSGSLTRGVWLFVLGCAAVAWASRLLCWCCFDG